jgi:acyl carrier protein
MHMTEQQVLDKLIELIEEVMAEANKQYTKTALKDAALVDLPLDSFDMLQLVFRLEEELKISLRTDMVYEAETVADLVATLVGLCQ